MLSGCVVHICLHARQVWNLVSQLSVGYYHSLIILKAKFVCIPQNNAVFFARLLILPSTNWCMMGLSCGVCDHIVRLSCKCCSLKISWCCFSGLMTNWCLNASPLTLRPVVLSTNTLTVLSSNFKTYWPEMLLQVLYALACSANKNCISWNLFLIQEWVNAAGGAYCMGIKSLTKT